MFAVARVCARSSLLYALRLPHPSLLCQSQGLRESADSKATVERSSCCAVCLCAFLRESSAGTFADRDRVFAVSVRGLHAASSAGMESTPPGAAEGDVRKTSISSATGDRAGRLRPLQV